MLLLMTTSPLVLLLYPCNDEDDMRWGIGKLLLLLLLWTGPLLVLETAAIALLSIASLLDAVDNGGVGVGDGAACADC